MENQRDISQLEKDIFSNNTDKVQGATNKLFEIGSSENISYLLELLKNEDVFIRDAVALTFRENHYSKAIPPLLSAIRDINNHKKRGTLVYALETMDCAYIFNDLFEILFSSHNNWSVHYSILNILDEQEFSFTDDDLNLLKENWNKLKPKWNKLNNIDETEIKEADITSVIIDEFVNRFTCYVDEE